MNQEFELKVGLKDWIFINLLGPLFGLLIASAFYFSSVDFQNFSTFVFGSITALFISLFASILITLSNNTLLPKVDKRFWYLISFFFSFVSGFLGFLCSFWVFKFFESNIVITLEQYRYYFAMVTGCLTLLVGIILHQFTSMKYKHEAIKSEMLQSKIKALENELNPHFLFNALNTITELVYIDASKAERALIDLSKFLRNAITKDTLLSVAQELQMVQTYVDIENVRFSNKIELHITQHKTFEKIQIPKFSIQLLVENAIKHGYTGKKLVVKIYKDNDTIVVENNGKTIKQITFGIGLTNLDDRLRLLKIGSLSYQSMDDGMRFVIQGNWK